MRLTQDNILGEFMRAGELQKAGRFAESADLWREIATAAPQSAEARVNYGGVLLELGDFAGAERALREALALGPASPITRYHLARVLHLSHRWSEAEAAYQEALALAPADPRIRLGLGQLHLALGDYARGWPLYEARSEIASQNAARLGLPGEWMGEPLDGRRLLIWPEQGFGDQIQFARFAPVVAAMGAQVTLVAPPALTALFAAGFAGQGVEVVAQAPGLTLPTPELWTLALSIPGKLGTTLASIPARPYLAAPDQRRGKRAGFARKGAVGVVWRGRQTSGLAHRSLPSLDSLRPLAAAGAHLVDLSEPVGDFADTAAIVEQLDLVVTVDTAVAHLAGALGKPCWVLLPWFRCDWRWLEDRADSPWYPSLTLFRQPRHGDWDSVIEAVASAYRTQFGS